MTDFKIDKDIAIPSSFRPAVKYPFDKMEIGDSFLVDGPLAARSAYTSAIRRKMKVCWRRQPDGSYRIWRTE